MNVDEYAEDTMEIAVSDDFVQELRSYARFGESANINLSDEGTIAMEIAVSDDYVRNIHPYARINDIVPNENVFKYRCIDCKFVTNKKSAYVDHMAENCVKEPEKNMKCPICDSMFTYRTLRLHLNYYVTAKYKPIGKHAKFTPLDHAILLEQHKQLKNKR